MKITIEQDDGGEIVLENVSQYVLVGCGFHKEITHYDINRSQGDPPYLAGKCFEMIERLRKFDTAT